MSSPLKPCSFSDTFYVSTQGSCNWCKWKREGQSWQGLTLLYQEWLTPINHKILGHIPQANKQHPETKKVPAVVQPLK